MKMTACFAAAILAVLSVSCRTIDGGEKGFLDAPAAERARMLKESEKLGDGILKAFQEGDFAALQRSMPGELGRQMTEKDFAASRRNLREKFGDIRDFEMLTALDTPAFGNQIWIVTFLRRGTNGAEIRRQLLFRLVTMEVDGKTEVASCGFL